MMKKETFFSRENLHTAIWSLLLGLVCFLAGNTYSCFTGKEKVVIATPDDGAQPLVVHVERAQDDPEVQALTKIDQLTEDVRQLRQTQVSRLPAGNATPPRPKDQTSPHGASQPLTVRVERHPDDPEVRALAKIDGLTEEVRRLREAQTNLPTPPAASFETSKTRASRINRPFLPAFRFPSIHKGYYQVSLPSFAESSCPAPDAKVGDVLICELFLHPEVNVTELTPAFVQLARGEDDQHLMMVSDQQYELLTGMNFFRVPLEKSGSYHLWVGFYARAELDREFPNYYNQHCQMIVH